ncbi:MAG: sensor histidine kinase, partial [Octadecabacter sp.]|nr:sensor histidine kinase [Octadecabacter sp.]
QQGTEGFEPIDLGALVAEIGETFGPVVEDNDKRLIVSTAAPATVRGDRQMLVQAAANLLQNALVHGGPEITLFAEGHVLGVADNGAGVDPAQFDEIIKPMVRLDAARSTEGTGLGLALVRAVSDRHGATLRLTPEQPQGLRVALEFAEM